MPIDSDWSLQAVSALDMSAVAASESIIRSNPDEDARKAVIRDDFMGGLKVPFLDDKELTVNVTSSDGPAFPLIPSGQLTNYDSGLIRPVGSSGEGSALDMARETFGLTVQDQAFSSNIAAHQFAEQTTGRLVNYTA